MQQKLIFFGALGAFGYVVLTAQPEAADAPTATRGAGSAQVRIAQSANDGGDIASGDELVLQRARTGQFHLTAQVDGQDTEFLVDTGADMVALTVDEAGRLGFAVDPSQFRPLTQTASGAGNGTVVRLGTLEVAGGEFHDVDAMVLDGLPVNLLGQSVPSRLGEVSLEGDRMVIRR